MCQIVSFQYHRMVYIVSCILVIDLLISVYIFVQFVCTCTYTCLYFFAFLVPVKKIEIFTKVGIGTFQKPYGFSIKVLSYNFKFKIVLL